MTSRAYGARGARSTRSHYDVILIVTSFATELATPTVTDVQVIGHSQWLPHGHGTPYHNTFGTRPLFPSSAEN